MGALLNPTSGRLTLSSGGEGVGRFLRLLGHFVATFAATKVDIFKGTLGEFPRRGIPGFF